MRKRHILILIALLGFVGLPWLLRLSMVFHINDINHNRDNYYFMDAEIDKVKWTYGDNYKAIVQYEYNGSIFSEELDYGIRDIYESTIPIAINRENGEVVRMNVAISFMDIAVTFAGIGLIVIEFIRYSDEKRRYKIRKAKEAVARVDT